MRTAKLFSIFVFIVLLGYGSLGYYFLPLANFEGDLTRMSMLPEAQFGWRQPQPALDIQWMQQAPMQEADVLVIGDSFSAGLVWQTVLTRNGYKVRTEHWDSIRAICTDFMPWLKSQGFRGKYVVVEMIERNVVSGLQTSVACQRMDTHTNVSANRPRYPPPISLDFEHKDRSGRLSVGIRTALNSRKYETLSSAPDFGSARLANGVRLARVKNSCELFSHASCNDVLFLAADKADDIADSALENIEKLNARMMGITPIWALVPNKSTAYLYPDKQFWNKAEKRFHAPNLLRMTQHAIEAKTVDLYPANNTHFSTSGYLLMGEEILKAMRRQGNAE